MSKVICFGEIMVRLQAPGYYKILQANELHVNYTGAEANVAVSLSRFGVPCEFVSKLPANDVALAALNCLQQYAVGVQHVVLGGDRIGVYYLEKGASQRPSKVIYDRKYSAIAQAKDTDFAWEEIFRGATHFHFTGITVALSPNMVEICTAACQAARAHGLKISCDLNYRAALWTEEEAKQAMEGLLPYVDILIANEEDAERSLGLKAGSSVVNEGKLDQSAYAELAQMISLKYSIPQVAFTLRSSISASRNLWSGLLYEAGNIYHAAEYDIQLVDRVGGGDSFGAALLYALINSYSPADTIEFAVAASCLKQTIESDFNLASLDDIWRLMGGDASGRVQR